MSEKILAYTLNFQGVSKEAESLAKIEQSLRRVNDERKKLNRELKEGNLTSDQAAKKDQALITTQKELSISKQKLTKELKQNITAYKTSATSIEGMRARMAQLRTTMNQLDTTAKGYGGRMKTLKGEYDQLNTKVRNFDRSLSGSNTLVGEYSRGFSAAFKGMAMSVVGATAALGLMKKAIKDAFDVVANFEQGMADVRSVLLPTEAQFKQLQTAAIDLGGSTKYTATEVAGLQKELGKLGFSVNEILNSEGGILDFAVATGSDLSSAAKIAGVAIRAFGLETTETERVVSTMAVATARSAIAVEDYETILSTVGPVARTYGLTLEETVAMVGKLRDAGFDASKASTAFRNILLNLADANGDLAKALGGNVTSFDGMIDGLIELNDKGIDLNTTLQLTDKRSVSAFSQFLIAAEDARKLKDQITGVNEQLGIMVDYQMNTLKGKLTQASSANERFTLAMLSSEKGLGAMKGGIDLMSKTLNAMADNTQAVGIGFEATLPIINAMAAPIIYNLELINLLFGKTKETADELNKMIPDAGGTGAEWALYKKMMGGGTTYDGKKSKGGGGKKTSYADVSGILSTIENEKVTEDDVDEGIRLSELYANRTDEIGQNAFDNMIARKDAERQAEANLLNDKTKLNDEQRRKDEIKEKEHQKNKSEIMNASFETLAQVTDIFYARNLKLMDRELAEAGDNEAAKEAIKRKYAKKQQKIDYGLAVIGMARAIMNALQSQPFLPMGPIMAGIAAAQGGIQLAAIAQQSFATGGMVKSGYELPGSRRNQDNTLALVKPGEAILNREQQARAGGPDFFKRIGVPGFDSGGLVGSIPQPMQNVSSLGTSVADSLERLVINNIIRFNINELHRAEKDLEYINETNGV